jgi:DUF4097 and DUF4098 domain-containing protein YvlB
MKSCLHAIVLVAALLAPAARGDELRRTVPVQPGGQLEIDLDGGSVEVEGDDEAEVSVDCDSRSWGGGALEFELTSDGRDARLVGRASHWLPFFGGAHARVRARVPERYSVIVRTGGGSIEISELEGRVEAETSGGSIEVSEIAGPVSLDTSGGPIRAAEIKGDLVLRTSGGSLRITEVDGRVEARTSGGSIDVHEVSGEVVARTSGGSISIRFLEAPVGDAETSGGSIDVEVPGEAQFDLEASTSGGRVRIEQEIALRGDVDASDVRGSVNGGGPRLRLRTSGGNIRVRAR